MTNKIEPEISGKDATYIAMKADKRDLKTTGSHEQAQAYASASQKRSWHGCEPNLPQGIENRAADCWESLIAIADVAGDDWPKKAREAAVFLTRRSADEMLTKGVELLSHIREAFGAEAKLWTITLLAKRLLTGFPYIARYHHASLSCGPRRDRKPENR